MKMDISHVAKLANIPLSDEEKKRIEPQLVSVLEYVEKLQSVDTTNVTPTSQVTGLTNSTGDDISRESLDQKTVLSQAGVSHESKFQVKGIFEE